VIAVFRSALALASAGQNTEIRYMVTSQAVCAALKIVRSEQQQNMLTSG
jgi:hypothetical protein